MPLYEYECTVCNTHFTLLRPMHASDADVSCQQCGTSDIKRLFSMFAAQSKDSLGTVSSVAGGTSSCSGAACSLGSCGPCGCG